MSKKNENNDLLKRIVESSPAYLWASDEFGNPTYYNNELRAFLGIPQDGDLSNWHHIVHKDDIETTLISFNNALLGQRSYSLECRILRADKQWRSVLAQGKPIFNDVNEFKGFVGSTVDINDVKLKNDAIKESESQLSFAIDAADLGVWDYNPKTHKFNTNKRMRDWYGLGENEDIDAESGLAAIVETDRGRITQALYTAMTWGQGDYNEEYHIKNLLTGEVRTVCARGKATFGEDKIAFRFNGIVQDVTVQAEAKRKMDESHQRFQDLIRDASTAIVVHTGLEMKVEVVNEAYARLINLKPIDLLGKPIFSVIPEAEEHFRPQLERVMHTGETIQEFDTPYSITTDGAVCQGYVNVTYQPFRNEQKQILGVMVIAQDVTESVYARKKLEQSEKNFEAAIAAVEGIIWTNNANGEMEGEQPSWTALTGQTLNEYKGYRWTNAVHPDDAQPTVEAWNNAVKNKTIFEFEHRLKTINKGWRLFSIKAVPSFDTDGNIQQWVGVHTDITDQKAAIEKIQESEERFRSLTQTLPQLIWMTDAKGKLEFASNKWIEYTGVEPGSENEWELIVHPDDYDGITKEWDKSIASGKIYNYDVRLKNKRGDFRWHSVIGEPVLDNKNKIVKWVGAFTDTHSEKLFKQELESQVANRTTQLEESNSELERKNRELESFTYVASHDLQEPLRKIQTFTSALLDYDKDKLSDKGKYYIDRILKATVRMRALIKDLLNFSSLNFMEAEFEDTDITSIVNDFKEEFEEIITEKKATIETSEEMSLVNVIPYQFQQLLHNLLENAIKYTEDGITPHIIIKSVKVKGNQLNNPNLAPLVTYSHISIADNGIGIPAEHLGKIFEVFKRLHHKHEYSGTGIGLSIVKKVVENHKGEITVESEVGRGTVFNIYLPA